MGHCAEMERVYKPVSLTCVRETTYAAEALVPAPKDTPGIALQ